MGYAYLADEKPPKFGYTITVAPKPPADKAKVHVLAASKKEIYATDLEKDRGGDFELDLHRLELGDSPLTLKFVFEKEKDPSSPHETTVTVDLAEPAPGEISAPPWAWLGQEVELAVTKWVALVHSGGTRPEEIPESDVARVGDAKSQVKWRVDGKDLAATGEKVKLEIAKEHLGKALHVEAYIGTPSGRAVAKIDAIEIVSIDPDDSPKNPTKIYINLEGGEAKHEGRTTTIKAHLSPAVGNVPIFFKLDDSKVRESRIDKDHLQLPGENTAVVFPFAVTDDRGVARAVLTLSTYGGDQYRVSASLDSDAKVGAPGTKLTRWLQVWRALDLEVSVMQRPDGGIAAVAENVVPRFIARFAEQFIEIRKTAGKPIPFRNLIAFPYDSSGPDPGEQLSLEYRNSRSTERFIHLCFVHGLSFKQYTDTNLLESDESWGREDKGKPSFGRSTFDSSKYLLDTSSKKNAFTSVSWATTDDGPRTPFSLEDGDGDVRLAFSEKDHAYVVTTKVADKLGPGPDGAVSVFYELINWIPMAGYSTDGNATFVSIQSLEQAKNPKLTAADIRTGALVTALHETSHKLGMAAEFFPEAPKRENDTTYPSDFGWHCRNGHDAGHDCIMYEAYEQTTGKPELRFCDRCQDALRARIVTKVNYPGNRDFVDP